MKRKRCDLKVDFTKPPKLDFLKKLTTPTGVLQHAKYSIPHRFFGYSLDDNARALIVMTWAYDLFRKKEYLELATVYMSFIIHAKEEGRLFQNFQTFDHKFLPKVSEDAFGECIWALGSVIASTVSSHLKLAAKDLFYEVEGNIEKIGSPRAKAYLILGLDQILAKDPKNKKAKEQVRKLAKDLVALYGKYHEESWQWFESSLTYANHILPAALFTASRILTDKKILEVATKTLAFLEKETHTHSGVPAPIGSQGWRQKGGKRAVFDQQPVEAAYAVIANLAAFEATSKREYFESARDWFSWFHGNNIKKVAVYDRRTAGCYDAVNRTGVNQNKGAESTICYLLAYLELAKVIKQNLRSKAYEQ